MNKVLFVQAVRKIHHEEWEHRCDIDGEATSTHIAEAVAKLNSEGYEVISTVPLASGTYSGLNSYGYSYTEGIVLIARRAQ